MCYDLYGQHFVGILVEDWKNKMIFVRSYLRSEISTQNCNIVNCVHLWCTCTSHVAWYFDYCLSVCGMDSCRTNDIRTSLDSFFSLILLRFLFCCAWSTHHIFPYDCLDHFYARSMNSIHKMKAEKSHCPLKIVEGVEQNTQNGRNQT